MTLPPQQPFVPLPLGPAVRGNQQDFRVLVAPRPENARALRDLTLSSNNGLGANAPHSTCEPRVTLQREGDRITGIHIQCSCGQTIDLHCAYPAVPAAAAAT